MDRDSVLSDTKPLFSLCHQIIVIIINGGNGTQGPTPSEGHKSKTYGRSSLHSSPLENFSLITETWADIVDMPVLESFASYLFMTINTVVPRMRGSGIMTFLQSLKKAKRRRRGPC